MHGQGADYEHLRMQELIFGHYWLVDVLGWGIDYERQRMQEHVPWHHWLLGSSSIKEVNEEGNGPCNGGGCTEGVCKNKKPLAPFGVRLIVRQEAIRPGKKS